MTGVLIGVFLYVGFFKPTYAPERPPAEVAAARQFSVVGQAYGGMRGPEFVRPSFRVLGDGSYTYQPGGVGDAALRTEEGYLPEEMIQTLQSLATADRVSELSRPGAAKDCRVHVDGYDYRYQFTLEGVSYSIDTCVNNVQYDDQLLITLDRVWSYVLDPAGYVPPSPGSGSSSDDSWLERLLKERLRGNNQGE